MVFRRLPMKLDINGALTLSAAVALTVILVLALGACPRKDGAKECPPCDEGEICDPDTGACIPDPDWENGGPDEPLPCGSDFDDCDEGEVCDLLTGECVPGMECDPNVGGAFATNAHCNWNTETNSNDPGWGCGGTTADSCVCDPTDGICKKRRQSCEPCSDDEECGPHSHFNDPAECVPYDGQNVCLVVASARGCPSGYLPEGDHCVPAGGSCEDIFACTSDADCPEDRPLCHRATGTCRAGCNFDFLTGDSVGCPPEQVCHQDGRCRAECETDDRCREIDESFVCYEEPTGFSRCRIAGCLHDSECPVPGDGPYLGFCDLNLNQCYDDRCYRYDYDGTLHEEPDRHCRDGFACREGGYCEQMACTERRAPSIACGYHQKCCGFCRNQYDNPERDDCDPTPCPSEFDVPEGSVEGCFLVDQDKWCAPCEDDDVCQAIDQPANDPRDLNYCGGEGMCVLTCEHELDCPTHWACQARITLCQTHDDCGAGECLPLDDEDPDSPTVCHCESDGQADDSKCGPGTRCLSYGIEFYCGLGLYCAERIDPEWGSYCD